MNSDDLRHGTIIVSEDQRHVLHRLTIAGEPAPTAMLASIPDDDDPDQTISIRPIVVAVLWRAILEGEVQVLEYGPGPRSSCPTPKPSIEDLMREGMIFYGSKLPVCSRSRSRSRSRSKVRRANRKA
ncbi:hypothetical protein [Sphingomonas aerolata]|uniref:hypothetical protein n=1 Tax=Sphingomonas aerolata TaxID=185951 RepID=UPI002FE15C40